MKSQALILLILIMMSNAITTKVIGGGSEFLVVITFNYIKPDVERLLCGGRVIGIVPEGVDPHDYQLRVSDIELLRSARLIVSTGHTGFEISIKNLVKSGELSARLIDIVEDILGLRMLTIPNTGQLNYHMPINDPVNYIAFITYLYNILLEIDSSNKDCYIRKYIDTMTVLYRDVLIHRNMVGFYAVADKPIAQYLLEWIGIRVLWILKPEEDYQPTPGDIDRVRELVSNRDIDVVVLTKPGDSPETRFLREIANEYNIPIIWIENPASSSGIIESLIQLIKGVIQIGSIHNLSEKQETTVMHTSNAILFVAIPASVLIGLISGILLARKRQGVKNA
ncbi:MAG: zinc ABC transporter substrate-binding protein [Desulfurococcaceae archaeon]